jgi:hypothetical protein
MLYAEDGMCISWHRIGERVETTRVLTAWHGIPHGAAASLLSQIAEMALTPEEEEERLQFQIEKYEEVFAFGEAQKPDSIAQEEVQPGVPQVGASGKKGTTDTTKEAQEARDPQEVAAKDEPNPTKLSRKSSGQKSSRQSRKVSSNLFLR